MRIEEGKYYRAANGEKIGPMMAFHSEMFPNSFIREHGDGFVWGGDGVCTHNAEGETSPYHLISEWTEHSPIRTETVTVRRLEPGVYGPLYIWREISIPDCDRPDEPPQREVEVSFAGTGTGLRPLNASEWRELARVALEIAEYLENV